MYVCIFYILSCKIIRNENDYYLITNLSNIRRKCYSFLNFQECHLSLTFRIINRRNRIIKWRKENYTSSFEESLCKRGLQIFKSIVNSIMTFFSMFLYPMIIYNNFGKKNIFSYPSLCFRIKWAKVYYFTNFFLQNYNSFDNI